MAEAVKTCPETITRQELIELLNEDLAREYQQEHQIDLATALGETPPDLSRR